MSTRSLGEPIAGSNNLYAWGEHQIVKLFGDGAPEDWVKKTNRVDRALHAAGLPVPAAGEVIEIDGHLGLVYERVEGGNLADALLSTPEKDYDRVVGLARTFAEVHAEIHACGAIPEVPSQRELLKTVISRIASLSPDLQEAVLSAFDKMPTGGRLCHGDFHPYNVLMSSKGPVVIDWNNAHIGNPLEDVARSALMLDGLAATAPPYRATIDRFTKAYLARYLQCRPGNREQLAAWRPIVAAVRLIDGIPELEGWLLDQIRAGLTP